MLAMRLAVMHNLYFYNELAGRIREALDAGQFSSFRGEYSPDTNRWRRYALEKFWHTGQPQRGSMGTGRTY